MSVRVVTDSAADLPSELARRNGILVAPLGISFDGGEPVFGMGADEFWEQASRSGAVPATTAPGPDIFRAMYDDQLEQGADGVVSVHLSSRLSETCAAARAAAARYGPGRVTVVDSRAVSAATALLALRACDLAARDAGPADIAADLDEARHRLHVFATVDTLAHLRRGGRIGGAQAMLGTMLQVKPVIGLVDGAVEPVGRVRTRARALQHLADLVHAHAGDVERVVALDGRSQDVAAFVELVTAPLLPAPEVWTLGPVVGAHTGPGAIGVVFATTT